MKRKLLLAALVVVSALGFKAQAQIYIETDLTSQFNSLATTQWSGSSGQVGWAAPKVTTNSGLTVAAWESYRGDCKSTGDIMYTTVSGLAAGTYKIELYGAAAFTFGRGFGSTAFTGDFSKDASETYSAQDHIDTETGVFLYAVTSENEYQLEIPIYYATDFNAHGLSTVILNDVVVGSNGEIKIGMKKTSQSTNWHVVQLKGVTATVNAVDALAAVVSNANTAIQSCPASIANNVQAVVTEYNKEYSTGDEYKTAIESIAAAVETTRPYVTAKPKLENIASVLENTNFYATTAYNTYYGDIQAKFNAATLTLNEANDLNFGSRVTGNVPNILLSNWKIGEDDALPTDKGLYINTWSTEGNGDGSNFRTPFFEYWVTDANALAAKTLTGTMTGLPEGTYKLTVWARVRMQNGQSMPSGITLQVNNGKLVDVTKGEKIGSSPLYISEFNAYGTVGEDGILNVKFNVEEGNTVSWLAFKNVTFEKVDFVFANAIELDATSLSLTTGDAATLTATVGPENATDKSVEWTSSDETVATVLNGKIQTLKSGVATITAEAVGAETTVTATATVTVTDAAAPASYSDIAEGDFYIVNAATGKFLGGANSWGTQASLIEHGIPFTAALNDGKYTLDSHTYNNETDHYLNGSYVDQGATPLYITSLGGGKYSISTEENSAFLTATGGSTVVANTAADANSTFAQWYFVSKADRDELLVGATAENPVDATYYIKQANISRNLSAGDQGENAWSNLSTGGDQDNTNFVAQVWNATADVSQTITDIPNGRYTLTMQGFTSGDVKLIANDAEVAVRANDSGATSCAAASVLFAAKSYPNTLDVTVTDNTLTISLEGDCSSAKWLCYDNFELYMTEYFDGSATMEISDAKWATFCAPFDVVIPKEEGVEAYTIDRIEENGYTLHREEVENTIPANTPVVLYSETPVNKPVAGKKVAYVDLVEGLLTGVYADTPAKVGTHVLQHRTDLNGAVGFYEVKTEGVTTVPAYRAYLTVPAGAKARAFFFDGDATAIEVVSTIAADEIEAIYTTAGAQVESLQKGLNIVVLKNGQTQKVFVK